MSRRVLVVDDNEDVRLIVQAILTAHGDEVLTAPDGVTALRTVSNDGRLDVVVLDIMMPEMNGLEVLERLRENNHTASIPVVFLTALDRDVDLLAGYKSGADYYITKPFTARQLLYAVDAVSERGRSKHPSQANAASDESRRNSPSSTRQSA